MFKRRFYDASESTREACLLGGQFCWHPVLPDPAPPLRHALRPDLPVVCPGCGLDRLLILFMQNMSGFLFDSGPL